MRFSLIKYCTHLVTPLSLIFAIFFFLRGHNSPGGGFIGGLVVATAFVLYAIAFDLRKAQRLLPSRFERVFSFGLGLAALTGLIAYLVHDPFLTSYQGDLYLGPLGKFHVVSSVFFDFGIFLIVIAVVAGFVFQFAERSCQLYWPGMELEADLDQQQRPPDEQLTPGWEKFAEGSKAAQAAAVFLGSDGALPPEPAEGNPPEGEGEAAAPESDSDNDEEEQRS